MGEELRKPAIRAASTEGIEHRENTIGIAVNGGPEREPICRLISRVVDGICASLTPADKDHVYGRLLLRLLEGDSRRLQGIRDPHHLSAYVRRLVEHERAGMRNRATKAALFDPAWFDSMEFSGGGSGGRLDGHDNHGEWLRAVGLTLCTDLERTVLLLMLDNRSWGQIAQEAGLSRDSARHAYARAIKRIRRAVAGGDVPPPPLYGRGSD